MGREEGDPFLGGGAIGAILDPWCASGRPGVLRGPVDLAQGQLDDRPKDHTGWSHQPLDWGHASDEEYRNARRVRVEQDY